MKVVVGLGKTGFSCVKYLVRQGIKIAVIDNRESPPESSNLRKLYPDIPVHLGNFNSDILSAAEEIIISPGVALKQPEIAGQLQQGKNVIGDIELFARHINAPVIAITGSNGKSTVTTLVGEMAKNSGLKVGVGGNLGTPALDLITEPEPDLYVLELSSFQLETTFSLRPKAAVVLNISPDHLDRYRDLDEYITAKMNIYKNCAQAVINRDELFYNKPEFLYAYKNLKTALSFGLNAPQNFNFGFSDGYLMHGTTKLLSSDELRIKGTHQIANALAALALGYAAQLPVMAMLETLREFSGLRHRCQLIKRIEEIDWYNDSKGTNVGATQAAIEGLGDSISGKIILIAGGQGKNADFSLLFDVVEKYVRTLILIGEDAPKLESALGKATKIIYAKSMSEAVKRAREQAQKKDVVLLSPACASFDMFDNYEHRGEVFIQAVNDEYV